MNTETRTFRLLAGLLILAALAGCTATERPAEFDLYLVRHAEKASEASDPELTQAGHERAAWLATWLADRPLAAVWSSDYQRTRDTAAPTAQTHQLPLIIYDPRDLDRLAIQLLERKETALVVGHSNTTPELAALLCGCPVEPMDDSEFDRIIVVTPGDGKARVETLNQTRLRNAAGN